MGYGVKEIKQNKHKCEQCNGAGRIPDNSFTEDMALSVYGMIDFILGLPRITRYAKTCPTCGGSGNSS